MIMAGEADSKAVVYSLLRPMAELLDIVLVGNGQSLPRTLEEFLLNRNFTVQTVLELEELIPTLRSKASPLVLAESPADSRSETRLLSYLLNTPACHEHPLIWVGELKDQFLEALRGCFPGFIVVAPGSDNNEIFSAIETIRKNFGVRVDERPVSGVHKKPELEAQESGLVRPSYGVLSKEILESVSLALLSLLKVDDPVVLKNFPDEKRARTEIENALKSFRALDQNQLLKTGVLASGLFSASEAGDDAIQSGKIAAFMLAKGFQGSAKSLLRGRYTPGDPRAKKVGGKIEKVAREVLSQFAEEHSADILHDTASILAAVHSDVDDQTH